MPLNAGRMTQRITIQRRTPGQDAHGQSLTTWQDVATVWAEVIPTRGREFVAGQAIEALFGGPSPRSQTETSLLERAGRDRAALGARSIAGDPETRVVDKGQTTLAIVNSPETASQIASAE